MIVNNTDFTWQPNDINSCLPILLVVIFFSLYWYLAKSEKIKKWFHGNNDPDKASVKHITYSRIIGFISMGVFPLLLCLAFMPGAPVSAFGISIVPETALFTLTSVLILCALIVPVTWLSARKSSNLANYPQIRAQVWTRKTVLINVIGWALYLLGYEILFRGVLLFPVADSLGVWPAIAINVALYSATHIPKGLTETVGAAPLGLVLCVLTLVSGTIWIAYLVHLVMALTNSFASLKFHPDMTYQSS
jgi:membrane protease YdiL (CAAX protease family)